MGWPKNEAVSVINSSDVYWFCRCMDLIFICPSLLFIYQVTGEITYNGYTLAEFIPQKTSAYISQNDLHIPEMTVRETIDFSARCQGVGSRAGIQPVHICKSDSSLLLRS